MHMNDTNHIQMFVDADINELILSILFQVSFLEQDY